MGQRLQDIIDLVNAAGHALKAMAALSPRATENPASPTTLEAQKSEFKSWTEVYFRLLHSISVRLKRQIYALEEADIITSEAYSKELSIAASSGSAALGGGPSSAPMSQVQGGVERPSRVIAGGLGNLDVGWLNSRNDSVGREMEAELWAQAKALLDRFQMHMAEDTAQFTEVGDQIIREDSMALDRNE